MPKNLDNFFNAEALSVQLNNYMGDRKIPGDAINAVYGLLNVLEAPELLNKIKSVPTFEEYLYNNKFVDNPEMARAVLEKSDKEYVKNFNILIEKINLELLKIQGGEGDASVIEKYIKAIHEITHYS